VPSSPLHRPCPLHPHGKLHEIVHPGPARPASHMSHVRPLNPALHSQRPVTHSPRASPPQSADDSQKRPSDTSSPGPEPLPPTSISHSSPPILRDRCMCRPAHCTARARCIPTGSCMKSCTPAQPDQRRTCRTSGNVHVRSRRSQGTSCTRARRAPIQNRWRCQTQCPLRLWMTWSCLHFQTLSVLQLRFRIPLLPTLGRRCIPRAVRCSDRARCIPTESCTQSCTLSLPFQPRTSRTSGL
jgi:hypothetical protein